MPILPDLPSGEYVILAVGNGVVPFMSDQFTLTGDDNVPDFQ